MLDFHRLNPPVPQEHGAWFMLYVPLLTVLICFRSNPDVALLLLLTVTGAFFGQHTAVLLIRDRARPGSGPWLTLYGLIFAFGSALLLVFYGLFDLIYLGVPAAVALIWLFTRSRFARKRIDRTFSGEILAIAGLALTAPAAAVAATGQMSQTAIGLWGLYVLFFGSSVLYVKMRIAAVQKKAGIVLKDRLVLGSGLLVYHAALALNLVAFYAAAPIPGQFLLIGFAPILIRAAIGWTVLSNRLPNLKRVGLIESAYTLWFSGWLTAAVTVLNT
jgi:hypothetical protein